MQAGVLPAPVLRSAPARAAGVVVLLAGLFGLAVWFGSLAPAPAVGAYPTGEDLGGDYDRYVGERAVVAGPVVETDPLVVAVADGDGSPVRYRLVGAGQSLDHGDDLWAFATVEPDHTLRVERSVVLTPAGQGYARGISLLAGLWVLARVVRDWRVDRTAAGLVPRSERDAGGDEGA
jgi:hypothetical protein